ncbi:hypothetical protein P153DRAFT_398519 [Dothidotthia symphoricarpi CBS 119687]|uniref:Uncharacterized protein n=1 Tax=Dothidotthia symphoricarpi CBS 119687 TaxID=1392245 RepID=A0A6A6A7M2_9PLEO|nr:uncharacterized protein P153DRAFT_398519 [Dothidotthia symphoricarpi CBS 119687]KAF2127153.1 hypothetical protein P153DRAFT_398519 [Dothidotthia symphoricarpi CBS 119687]
MATMPVLPNYSTTTPHSPSLPPSFSSTFLLFHYPSPDPLTPQNIAAHTDSWNEAGAVDPSIYAKCASADLTVPIASGKSISPLFKGLVVSAPPLLNPASPSLQDKTFPSLLTGTKRICVAITEPDAGQRRARRRCKTARTTSSTVEECITNGLFSDSFMALVRTGGPALTGLSMLFIPLGGNYIRDLRGRAHLRRLPRALRATASARRTSRSPSYGLTEFGQGARIC